MSVFSIVSKDGSEPIPAVYAGGDWRLLASKPSPHALKAAFPPFGATNPVIPRSQWKAVSRPRAEVPILDQNGRGSCVGHGAATAMMLARSIAGKSFQLLSAPFVYSQINGGFDNGSSPGDAAKTLLAKGVCLMSEFPEPNFRPSQVPASAFQTALRFKALDIYSCANFDEAVSAFLLGFSVFDTVMVGARFNNLDSDGVPPVAFGPGNHCVAFGDSLKQTQSGAWVAEHRNSWGTSWGMNGLYFQSEAHCTRQGNNYEAYAIRDVYDDPQDSTNPPVA